VVQGGAIRGRHVDVYRAAPASPGDLGRYMTDQRILVNPPGYPQLCERYNDRMSGVSLRFLGCGDAFFSGARFHTCFLLEGAEEPMLIDCGATSLVALKREGIDPASIGVVAVSHLHGDHFGGLPWLILDGTFSARKRPLVIAGPEGTEERLARAFEALYPGATSAPRPFELSFVEWADGARFDLGPAVVTPFEVIHSSGAPPYALRVKYGDKVIAYSGDTEWTDNLLVAARDGEVLTL
jgi:ribonuclease BN (tRNA processing enzyme)